MAFHQWETAQSLLNKGHISRADFENQTLQRLTAEQQLTLAKKDRRREQTNIAKLHHEIATLPKRQANEMANLENAGSNWPPSPASTAPARNCAIFTVTSLA